MQRINIIDLGRFIAAFIVLLFHYFYSGINNGKVTTIGFTEPISSFARYGHIGVPFFFMISGYVIYYSAINKTAFEFITSRAKRLYPAYWVAIVFTTIISFSLKGGPEFHLTWKQILINLTMLQHIFNVKDVDGVYWTLFVELKFYMVVFFILFVLNEKFLLLFFKIWPFLILIFAFTGYLKFICDYQFCYFSYGILIALYDRERKTQVLVPLIVSVGLCFYTINLHSFSGFDTMIYSGLMLLCTVFFYSLTFDKVKKIKIPYSYILGALTYPVYLVHAHFGYLSLINFANESNKLYVYPIIMLIVFSVAYSIHYFMEKKNKDTWNIFFPKLLYPIFYLENIYKKSRLSNAISYVLR